MMKPEPIKIQQDRRIGELFAIARQRYLDAGGDPYRSANETWMTEAERQEFLELGRQVFDDEYINNYLERKHQSHQVASQTRD